MQCLEWKKHAARGWGIATGLAAACAGKLAMEFGWSMATRSAFAGLAGGTVALMLYYFQKASTPDSRKSPSESA